MGLSKVAHHTKLGGPADLVDGYDAIQTNSKDLRSEPMKNSRSSSRPSAWSCTWVRAILVSIQTGREWMDWGQPWREGLGSTGGGKIGHGLAMCACSPERQTHPELYQKQHGQQAEGDYFSHLLSAFLRSHLEKVFCSGIQYKEERVC